MYIQLLSIVESLFQVNEHQEIYVSDDIKQTINFPKKMAYMFSQMGFSTKNTCVSTGWFVIRTMTNFPEHLWNNYLDCVNDTHKYMHKIQIIYLKKSHMRATISYFAHNALREQKP